MGGGSTLLTMTDGTDDLFEQERQLRTGPMVLFTKMPSVSERKSPADGRLRHEMERRQSLNRASSTAFASHHCLK